MIHSIVLNRAHYRDLCQDFLHEESYGMISPDDVLDVLCRGIKGCMHDLTYIRNMVFSDLLFQGHFILSDTERMELLEFFGTMRIRILEELSLGPRYKNGMLKVRYIETKSKSGLLFEVLMAKSK